MAGRESGESGAFRRDRSEEQPVKLVPFNRVSPGPPKRSTQLSTPHLLAGYVSSADLHRRIDSQGLTQGAAFAVCALPHRGVIYTRSSPLALPAAVLRRPFSVAGLITSQVPCSAADHTPMQPGAMTGIGQFSSG